jgi:Gpi18-like mannosyltransferase
LLAGSTWAFVFLRDRRYLAAGVAGAVATLARPNGIAVVVALAVAVWSDARASPLTGTRRPTARRLVTVCGPGMAALTLWCVELARWTGNPLVFWTAKRAWYEVTVIDLIRTWPGDATTHVVVGLLAFAVIALAWRRLPAAWTVFAALYLLPSFGFGLVGLGRYVGECFPVLIATGIVLAGARRQIVPVVLTASAVAMVALALVITTEGIIP